MIATLSPRTREILLNEVDRDGWIRTPVVPTKKGAAPLRPTSASFAEMRKHRLVGETYRRPDGIYDYRLTAKGQQARKELRA